jgi:ATP-dependent helicase HrpB
MAPVPASLPLPIDDHLTRIVDAVRRERAAIVTAAPGAGKTTRVPPALVADGPVLLLQPRRVAARAIARRIAFERGWTVGREVGWHVRFERNFSGTTSLLVATEGVLTARLQQDPLAAGFNTIVIDEFHERSLHADLGLALAREAWRARTDLRLVVMSATLDAARVAAYLGGCPVIEVPGRRFPLEISYHPGLAVDHAVTDVLASVTGAVLCFLPGAPEIRRAAEALGSRPAGRDVPVLPLHGGLDADAQDAAIVGQSAARVILATNLAETTVTVPDVTVVIDTGLHKVARYDADRGIDSLETERVSQDSADQRAGRAGRVQAGRVLRLWDPRDRLRPHREPEIARVDLAATALDVIAWGADPRQLAWFEPPPADSLDAALSLLQGLGAIDTGGHLTVVGRTLARLPLHPRLGRMLLAGRLDIKVARACALLSERHVIPARRGATSCDLLSAVDDERSVPPHVRRVAAEVQRVAGRALEEFASRPTPIADEEFRRAVLAGYPDRVARRRGDSADRFVLASGAGARLARESGVVNAEFVVAVDVTAAAATGGEALIRLATGIEREWIETTGTERRHEFDEASGTVRASRVELYRALRIAERSVPADPLVAGPIVAREYIRRGPRDADAALLRRLAFAGIDITFESLVEAAAVGTTKLGEIELERALSADVRRMLVRDAPAALVVPSGREVALEYRDDGGVAAAVKLQELFGLGDSPRVGRARVPVTFQLLSPAGRPVQVTRDLKSFWSRGYPEVRKELRARYPKHPWPDDPWTAQPTARPLRRRPR